MICPQNMIKLSVIIPAYNEEKRIEKTLRAVDSYLEKQNFGYEIIVIDNNSKDKTFEVVRKLETTTVQNARAIKQWVRGKGAAVQLGIAEARGEFAVFMDADNATPISEIEKFWQYLESGIEVVIGSRYQDQTTVKIKQPFYKILLSRMSNMLIQIVLIPHIKDTQCGFKAFSAESAERIFSLAKITGWGFDIEVLSVGRALGYRIKEVPVTWVNDAMSHVKFSAYAKTLIEALKIRWNLLTGKYK